MMNKREDFNPCPRCGGTPTLMEYHCTRDSEYTEIQCIECGLTLKYSSDYAYSLSGGCIDFAPNITWSYVSEEYNNVAEAWNAGVTL